MKFLARIEAYRETIVEADSHQAVANHLRDNPNDAPWVPYREIITELKGPVSGEHPVLPSIPYPPEVQQLLVYLKRLHHGMQYGGGVFEPLEEADQLGALLQRFDPHLIVAPETPDESA